MNVQRRSIQRWALAVAAVSFALAAPTAHAVTIDWVTVGDPGNTGETQTYDTGGTLTFGAVADTFRIMKFEWTNSQYVEFLNAVDPNGTNPNSVYNNSMGSNARSGVSFTSGNSAGSKYSGGCCGYVSATGKGWSVGR